MKLIDRYMNALAQYLPQERREEIVRELRANVMDKLDALADEHGRTATDDEISQLLLSLGHPQKVAAAYLPPQQLVANELLPFYKQVLSYGVLAMFSLEILKVMGAFFSSGQFNLLAMGFQLAFGFVDSALIMFASVTGIFYVLSNPPSGKTRFQPYRSWRPEHLPPVTQAWQKISLGEQSGEFSISLFFVLLLHYPLIMSDAALAKLTVSFADPLKHWLPWLAAMVGCSMVFNLWNLRYSFWTKNKLLISATLNLATAGVLIAISHLPVILASVPGKEDPAFSLAAVNHAMATGLLITGLWLLYECGRDLYRAWLLR